MPHTFPPVHCDVTREQSSDSLHFKVLTSKMSSYLVNFMVFGLFHSIKLRYTATLFKVALIKVAESANISAGEYFMR